MTKDAPGMAGDAFISGFLTGALAMLWFVIDCM